MEEKNVNQEVQAVKEPKKKSKVVLIVVLVVVVALLGVGGYLGYRAYSYNTAIDQMKAGDYDTAKETFDKLDDYKLSETYATECKAEMYIEDKEYEDAIKELEDIDYSDRIVDVKAMIADEHMANTEYEEALAIYEEIGYSDEVNEAKYQIAERTYSEGDIKTAYTMIKALDGYGSANARCNELSKELKDMYYDEIEAIEMPAADDYNGYMAVLDKMDEIAVEASEYDIDLNVKVTTVSKSLEEAITTAYFESVLMPKNFANDKYLKYSGIAISDGKIEKQISRHTNRFRYENGVDTEIVVYWHQRSAMDNKMVFTRWYYYWYDFDNREMVKEIWIDDEENAETSSNYLYAYQGWYGDGAGRMDPGVCSVELVIQDLDNLIAFDYAFSIDYFVPQEDAE